MQKRTHAQPYTFHIILICIVFFSIVIFLSYQLLKRKYHEQIICEFNWKNTELNQEFENFKKQYSKWPSFYLWVENNFPQSILTTNQKVSRNTECGTLNMLREYDEFFGSVNQKQNLIYKNQLLKIEESKNKIEQKLTQLKSEIPTYFQDVHKLCYFQQKFNQLEKLSLSIGENCKSNHANARSNKSNADKQNITIKNSLSKGNEYKKEKNCKLADEKLLLKKRNLLSTLTENTQKVKIKWPFFSESIPTLISHCENSHEWKIFE